MELKAIIVKFSFTGQTFSNESEFFLYKPFYPLVVKQLKLAKIAKISNNTDLAPLPVTFQLQSQKF